MIHLIYAKVGFEITYNVESRIKRSLNFLSPCFWFDNKYLLLSLLQLIEILGIYINKLKVVLEEKIRQNTSKSSL